jgi:hypothetical protein
MKLRDQTTALRALRTAEERCEELPAYVRAIGQALDVIEGRLKYIGECCGTDIGLTDITQRAGGNWLQRASRLNGLGDVAPLLNEMCGATGRIWDAIGLLSGDAEAAERSRDAFEQKYLKAPDIALAYELAEAIDMLDDAVAERIER